MYGLREMRSILLPGNNNDALQGTEREATSSGRSEILQLLWNVRVHLPGRRFQLCSKKVSIDNSLLSVETTNSGLGQGRGRSEDRRLYRNV